MLALFVFLFHLHRHGSVHRKAVIGELHFFDEVYEELPPRLEVHAPAEPGLRRFAVLPDARVDQVRLVEQGNALQNVRPLLLEFEDVVIVAKALPSVRILGKIAQRIDLDDAPFLFPDELYPRFDASQFAFQAALRGLRPAFEKNHTPADLFRVEHERADERKDLVFEVLRLDFPRGAAADVALCRVRILPDAPAAPISHLVVNLLGGLPPPVPEVALVREKAGAALAAPDKRREGAAPALDCGSASGSIQAAPEPCRRAPGR